MNDHEGGRPATRGLQDHRAHTGDNHDDTPLLAVAKEGFDPSQAQAFLRFLGPATREVRILSHDKYGRTAAGVFNDVDSLIAAVGAWDSKANIFVTMNPLNDGLLARANNRILARMDHTAGDKDVTRRTALLIDIDPKRPAGISSTDSEQKAACLLGVAVRDFLRDRGWPEPLAATSGNGCYLIYRIDEPNDDAATQLVVAVLKGLAARFDLSNVGIDTAVSNAGRIVALIGTKKVKGDSVPDRPHRYSRVLGRVPEPLAVTREQLSEVAAHLNPKSSTDSATSYSGLVNWLTSAGIEFRKRPTDGAGRTWYHLRRCPFHDDGRDFECGVAERSTDGSFSGKCFHPEGSGKGWKDFREALGLGRAPRTATSQFSLVSHDLRVWPKPPDEAAFGGFAGEFVRAVAPHTEADEVALLVNLLLWFGNAVGAGPGFTLGASIHHGNENALLVGDTAKSRKGESEAPVYRLFQFADEVWTKTRSQRGLSSGEGLIHSVRDAVTKTVKNKDGEDVEEVSDPGVDDKRLLVSEHEFASVTKVASRAGNTLSAVLRDAWDHRDMQILTRNSPLYATDPHVSILGHITEEELRRELTATDVANGFINRFIIIAVRRSKLLPSPRPFDGFELQALGQRLADHLSAARAITEMVRTSDAEELWAKTYESISIAEKGMVGSILARSEAHVLRLSIIYALLDGSPTITKQNLHSALALWAYADRSVRYLFGNATGDPIADRIRHALDERKRMNSTEISALFARHTPAAKLEAALRLLMETGQVRLEKESTNGAPVEWWIKVDTGEMSEKGEIGRLNDT